LKKSKTAMVMGAQTAASRDSDPPANPENSKACGIRVAHDFRRVGASWRLFKRLVPQCKKAIFVGAILQGVVLASALQCNLHGPPVPKWESLMGKLTRMGYTVAPPTASHSWLRKA
jgi:hypothetical protein